MTGTKRPLSVEMAHADVVEMVLHDFLAVEARVDRGNDVERVDDGLHEERHEAELDLVLLDEAVLELGAQRHDVGEIDLVEGGEVRGLLLRGEQARGDLLAQRRHLFARGALAGRLGGDRGGGGCGRGLRGLLRSGEDVALEDAAILARACDRGGIDAFFLGLVTDGGGKIVGVLCHARHRRQRARRLRRARAFPSRHWLLSSAAGARLPPERRFFIDAGHDLADLHRVARLDEMLQLPGAFGDDFGRDLVGLDFKNGIAGFDVGAVRLVPDAEHAGGDRFADSGDFDFDGHREISRS